MIEQFDLVIVGAGWHGLVMAKTYLEASAGSRPNIVILDEATSIGGTWAKERLYPGLKTNNIVGSYEFSDFPMVLDRYNLRPGQHIPGEVVHQYLADFARHFGLDACIRFQTRVQIATLSEEGVWLLECIRNEQNVGNCSSHVTARNKLQQLGQLKARRLVVATGVTSEPQFPSMPGMETYTGHLFHAKELHSRTCELTGTGDIVVVGGHKSAWDVCYSAASLSRGRVHMVIRPSGGGPSRVWRPLPFRMSIARLSSTRFFTWFDPSPFGSVWSPVRRLLHGTLLGRLIVSLFWAFLDIINEWIVGYQTPDLRPLRPWTSTFWMGNSLSVHNYDTNWFDLVKSGRVTVHHADVKFLQDKTVHLSNGQSIDADTIVCSTGWKCKSSIHFQPDSVAAKVDIPHAGSTSTGDRLQRYSKTKTSDQEKSALISQVSQQVTTAHPWLQTPPNKRIFNTSSPQLPARNPRINKLAALIPFEPTQTGYRLHRFLVPYETSFIEGRNLAFIGIHRSIHAVIVAQAQALWITAFFHRKMTTSLHPAHVCYETILHAEYERLRRPKEGGGSGASYPDLIFDSIPYVDLLLEDMGMRTMRKKTFWADIFEQYTLRDYRDLVGEWLSSPASGVNHTVI